MPNYVLKNEPPDQQKLVDLLKGWGFTQLDDCHLNLIPNECFIVRDHVITIGSGTGYAGFACDFKFDQHGKFVSHGCYE